MTHSIVHHKLLLNNCVLFSVDIKTGGDDCGTTQLSAVAVNLQMKEIIGEFDKYVKPPFNAQWSEATMTVHGIQPTDERIKSASGIETVWKEFAAFIEAHLSGGDHSSNKNQGSLLHVIQFPPEMVENWWRYGGELVTK